MSGYILEWKNNYIFFIIFFVIFLLPLSIIGGYEIKIYQAPYQVNYGDVCGGALLQKKWALTTAHCGTNHTYIRIGSSFHLKGSKVIITSHIIHPKYQWQHEFDFDVQLLALNRALHFSKQVAPIRISKNYGHSLYVAGWGYEKEQGDFHDTLQQVSIQIYPMEDCQKVRYSWYNHTLTRRMFCAGGWGFDACQGDSGGPAVYQGKLIGISSFGFGCGRTSPGVYMNVSETEIRKWIYDYTRI